MPGRHELATSRLSWLAIIPTCLAKIGILVPARRGLWFGREFCEQGTPRRLAPGASVAVSLPAQPVLVAARRVS
jgi:hypothetical protein